MWTLGGRGCTGMRVQPVQVSFRRRVGRAGDPATSGGERRGPGALDRRPPRRQVQRPGRRSQEHRRRSGAHQGRQAIRHPVSDEHRGLRGRGGRRHGVRCVRRGDDLRDGCCAAPWLTGRREIQDISPEYVFGPPAHPPAGWPTVCGRGVAAGAASPRGKRISDSIQPDSKAAGVKTSDVKSAFDSGFGTTHAGARSTPVGACSALPKGQGQTCWPTPLQISPAPARALRLARRGCLNLSTPSPDIIWSHAGKATASVLTADEAGGLGASPQPSPRGGRKTVTTGLLPPRHPDSIVAGDNGLVSIIPARDSSASGISKLGGFPRGRPPAFPRTRPPALARSLLLGARP